MSKLKNTFNHHSPPGKASSCRTWRWSPLFRTTADTRRNWKTCFRILTFCRFSNTCSDPLSFSCNWINNEFMMYV